MQTFMTQAPMSDANTPSSFKDKLWTFIFDTGFSLAISEVIYFYSILLSITCACKNRKSLLFVFFFYLVPLAQCPSALWTKLPDRIVATTKTLYHFLYFYFYFFPIERTPGLVRGTKKLQSLTGFSVRLICSTATSFKSIFFNDYFIFVQMLNITLKHKQFLAVWGRKRKSDA